MHILQVTFDTICRLKNNILRNNSAHACMHACMHVWCGIRCGVKMWCRVVGFKGLVQTMRMPSIVDSVPAWDCGDVLGLRLEVSNKQRCGVVAQYKCTSTQNIRALAQTQMQII